MPRTSEPDCVEVGPGTLSAAGTAYVLCIGVISGVVPSLQPVLLGQLAAEAKISLAEIGQAAMFEALGMLLSASIAGALLKPERLKLITIAAIGTAISINIATAMLSGAGLLVARFVAGLSAGLLLWIWIGLLARAAVPGRLVAIYVMMQTALLLAFSAILSAFLLPWNGALAGYGALALLYAALLLLVPLSPDRYAPLEGARGIALPSGRGLAGLFAVFLHMAAYMGLWVYVVPLAQKAGLPAETAGFAISLALGAQFAAGFVAGIIAARLIPAAALIASVTVSILALLTLAGAATNILFVASIAVLAFFWIIAIPFQVPYLIVVDPSRRAAMQIVPAQLLGVAAGPALASWAVAGSDVTGAIGVGIALFAVAGVVVVATVIRPRLAAEA